MTITIEVKKLDMSKARAFFKRMLAASPVQVKVVTPPLSVQLAELKASDSEPVFVEAGVRPYPE